MKRITTPPLTPNAIADFYGQIQTNIDKHGAHIMGIMSSATTPPFNYTIGLSEGKLGYELFMCGLRNDFAAGIMNDLIVHLENGSFSPDCVVSKEIVSNFPLLLARCTKELDWLYSDFTIQIERFYGMRKPVVQVIMSDKEGHIPWDKEFNIEYMAQFQPIFCEITP